MASSFCLLVRSRRSGIPAFAGLTEVPEAASTHYAKRFQIDRSRLNRVILEVAAAIAAPGGDRELGLLVLLEAGPEALLRLAALPGADRRRAVIAAVDDEPL